MSPVVNYTLRKRDKMSLLEKYKIKTTKRMLFFIAGSLWSFAGGRILTLGFEDLTTHAQSTLGYMAISVVVFCLFFFLIFSKMVKKHKKRIMTSSLTEHCVFSFFDFKGYAIMIFMIVGGISLRNSHLINPIYLGTFYLGLGSALLSAGILFLMASLNFNKAKDNHY